MMYTCTYLHLYMNVFNTMLLLPWPMPSKYQANQRWSEDQSGCPHVLNLCIGGEPFPLDFWTDIMAAHFFVKVIKEHLAMHLRQKLLELVYKLFTNNSWLPHGLGILIHCQQKEQLDMVWSLHQTDYAKPLLREKSVFEFSEMSLAKKQCSLPWLWAK